MKTQNWQLFSAQWLKDFQLLLFITVVLFAHRLIVLSLFFEQASIDTGWQDVLQTLWLGVRFDISTASKWVVVTFFLALLIPLSFRPVWLDQIRSATMWLFVSAGIMLLGMDLVFFGIYADHFNMLIFGLIYDDTQAILMTLWKEYHPVLFTFAAVMTVAAMGFLARKWMLMQGWQLQVISRLNSPVKTGLVIMPLFIIFLVLARGGMLTGPPLGIKHAFVTQDLFLNRVITNPMFALWEAFKTRARMRDAGAFDQYWPHGFDNAVNRVIARNNSQADSSTAIASGKFDDLLLRAASGRKGEKPRHVFLLLLESHSGWTVLEDYRHYGFSPELARLADEGVYLPGFLPGASGTIGAVNTLVTGMPDNDLNVNYQTTPDQNYASAIAGQFKKLGYQPRFYYGGLLGWQRLDSFLPAQGFDEVYGGGAMNAGTDMNEWGVDDKYLFDFISSKLDNTQPSFNLILTTSNHPPYDLDLEALGFPVNELPDTLKATQGDTLKVLGHLWYADKQLGRFVRSVERRFPDSLFAITGDHTARLNVRFPGDSVMEQVAVPLVLYGAGVLASDRANSQLRSQGSHIDIMPTLVELVAEKGFEYYSLGQNLLSDKPASYGFGYNYVIGREGLIHINSPTQVYKYPGSLLNNNPGGVSGLTAALSTYKALKALGWYRVIRGNSLPEANTRQ